MTDENGVATIDHQEVHVNVGHTTVNVDDDTPVPIIQTSGEAVEYKKTTESLKVSKGSTLDKDAPIVFQGKPDPSRKPKDFVVTSCFTIMLCNMCLGYAGYHFGVKANYAWQLGDEDTARRKARIAMIFVILAVIVGLFCWIGIPVIYFTT